MTALALPSIPVKARFGLIYTALILLGLAAAFTGAWLTKAHTFTQTVRTHESLTESLTRAYGTPQQTVDGGQVNPQLQGLSCAVYVKGRRLAAVVCK